MNEILCKVSEQDSKELYDSIVETEASKELYEISKKKMDCTAEALKVILDYYMHVLKLHKSIWKDILVKYIGEEEASNYLPVLRFDPVKKVIFKLNIEGCNLCNK